jgi:DNA polymerase-3 subunit gamma/tau
MADARDNPYQVIARKWRPQQFDAVVGQEHVTRTLRNAIQSGRLAHAYLLVGPRGTGKTSLARILAKALNCVNGPTITPCDKCDSCREIAAGNSLDVLEFDAASTTQVDRVRELVIDRVPYAPAASRFKIYIIDEVHMLSASSFNALLKTLEEPPPHVKFIFATTEPQKMLPTIVSRCQRFDLRRIPLPAIMERLTAVAKAEGVEIDSDALLAVGRGSDGSLRDAECALDQLISFKGKQIREEDALSVFGLVAKRTIEELAEAILKGDVLRLVHTVGELDRNGKDMQRVVLDLLDHFRNILVLLCAEGRLEALEIPKEQLEILRAQAGLTTVEQVLRVADLLLEAENRIRYALSKKTHIETTLIRCARAATAVSIDAILRQIAALKSQLGAGTGEAPKAYPSAASVAADAPRVAEVSTAAAAPDGGGGALQRLTAEWRAITEMVGKTASLAKSTLSDARPLSVEGDHVRIGFDPEFASDMERIDIPRYRKAVQRVLSDTLGRTVNVEFCLLSASDRKPLPSDSPAGAASKGSGSPRSRSDWLKDPTVQQALNVFDGTIVDIRS